MLDQVGLTVVQCEQAAWAVTPDRRRFRGAEAISVALDEILGWRIFQWIYRRPPLTRLMDRLYQWIADNRSRFPGVTPAVDRPDGWQPE